MYIPNSIAIYLGFVLCIYFPIALAAKPTVAPSRSRPPTRSPSKSPTPNPSAFPSLVPSCVPTSAPNAIIPYSCPHYSTSNTNNAEQNYIICSYSFSNYSQADVTVSTCATVIGDTYLRAFFNGTEIAYNDNGCSVNAGGSKLQFSIKNGQNITVHEGCYGSTECGGTSLFSFSNIISLPSPTNSPTFAPTYGQNSPTPLPTASPTNPTPLPTVPTRCSISIGQYNILAALYNQTNGSEWDASCNNWNFAGNDYTAPCYDWYGITCDANCDVIGLNLLYCNLQGSIPAVLGNLTSAQSIELGSNELSSTIPSSLRLLSSLQYLSLRQNQLKGTIPSELGQLRNLASLRLNINLLSGVIPTSLGALSNMYLLNMRSNSLSGTIPIELSTNLNQLIYLYLYNNNLKGKFNFDINISPILRIVEINNNFMTGTIPKFQVALENLNLKNNFFSGSITSLFNSNMVNLSYVDISFNSITGSLPHDLSEFSSLSYLNLASNLLIGSLPSSFPLALTTLDVSYNRFSSSIPIDIANIVGLTVLNLAMNDLTNTIPTQLGQLTNLVSLIASDNKLIGSIPQELSTLVNIKYLYLQNNELSGQLPAAVMMLPLLEGINLSDNQLQNSLNNLFTLQSSQSLQYVIFSHMHLTGSLPDALFELPLVTLVLTGNCITGTLPISVCNSKLTNLYLDGIGLSKNCHKDDDKSQFHGYIPSCIFSSMPKLETLHLAGNGLTGTLSSLSSSSNLSSLNLANNRLEGELPHSMQSHIFTSVDISSNKITGTLIDSFYPPSISLNMTKNRLSGKPPFTLQTMNENSVLNLFEGNLMGCPLLSNDINKDKVSCGSTELNIPFIVWLSLLVILIILLSSIFYSKNMSIIINAKKEISKWLKVYYQYLSLPVNASDADILALYHTRNALNILERACSVSLIILGIYVFVVMITFIGLKSTTGNGMYEIQYLFTTTSLYFHGNIAAAFIWIYLILASSIVTTFLAASRPLGLMVTKSGLHDIRRVNIDEEEVIDYQDYSKKITIQILIELFATIVILGINTAYLYIVYFIQPPLMTLINMVFAIIKVIMINAFIPSVIKVIRKNSRAIHYVTMIMMVSVIIPGLTVLLESPLCFYYKFTPASIFVTYEYPQVQYSIEGEGTGTTEVLYKSSIDIITPQWYYSYKCSSSFLNVYLPNFVYYYLINCFILPFVNFVAMVMPSRYLNKIIQKGQVMKIFNIIDDEKIYSTDNIELSNLDCKSVDTSLGKVYIKENEHQTETRKSSMHRIEGSETNNIANAISNDNEFGIDVSNLMPNLCVDIIMLLTFGLASPLLAILITFRILVNTILWRIALGRYIYIATKKYSLAKTFNSLEYAFTDEWRCLHKSWLIITILVGLFWSLFMFDIIGDKHPTNGVAASLLMLISYPLLFMTIQILSTGDINDNNPRLNDRISVITNSISINRIRSQLDSFLNMIHFSIWSRVLKTRTLHDPISNFSTSDNVGRITILKETISPLTNETIENTSTSNTRIFINETN